MEYRSDYWSHTLERTFDAPRHLFKEPGHVAPPDPKGLAARGSFEVSNQHKVALWYSGFVEEASRIDSIVRWLSGADDLPLVPATIC